MNLLPKDYSEFHKKEYWDSFFQKRGKKSFEWYGEFRDFKQYFQEEVTNKQQVQVLNIGCGNSELSAQLYDAGYANLTNVDFSEVVIREMISKNQKRKQMKWLVMDMLNMSFENESFDVVIDKGALDALYSEESKEIEDSVSKMFSEVIRVLKKGGKYFCITLAQEHILNKLLKTFQNGFHIKIYRIDTSEPSSLIPFFVSITKKKDSSEAQTIEATFLGTNIPNITIAWLSDKIKELQWQHDMKRKLKQGTEGVILELSLFDHSTGISNPRYLLTIVDQKRENTKNKKKSSRSGKCGVFIVPQGKEHEWMFATPEGQMQLAETANFDRLIIVALGRAHKFGSLQVVQDELSPKILELAPDKSEKIPFLTTAEGLGNRNIIASFISNFTGKLVVEEVKERESADGFRRLIFLNNPNLIQSEVKVVKDVIDHSFLTDNHQKVMVASLAFIHSLFIKKSPEETKSMKATDVHSVIIGLGGGILPMFLYNAFPNMSLDVVDIDPIVVQVAKQHFGLIEDSRLKTHVADGLDYIKSISSPVHLLIIDVDSKDLSLGMNCPPPAFVELGFLQVLKQKIDPNGMFMLNLVCRSKQLYNQVIQTLKQVFERVEELEVSNEDVNKIICCFNQFELVSKKILEEGCQYLSDTYGYYWKQHFNIAELLKNHKVEETRVLKGKKEDKNIENKNEEEEEVGEDEEQGGQQASQGGSQSVHKKKQKKKKKKRK